MGSYNGVIERRLRVNLMFKDGDRWEMINSLVAGASRSLCNRNPELYDPRPYGVALEASYPGLRENAEGEGTEAARELLLESFKRGSQPMCVAALLANAPTDGLTLEQESCLNFLITLACKDPDLCGVFAGEESSSLN